MQIDLSIFNPSKRPLIGVDLSSSAVKMVELAVSDKSPSGYKIERYCIEPLPREVVMDGKIINIDLVSAAIERAWKRLGSSTRYIAMALPASAVITKKINLPADLREQEMEFQVESEANQYIPFALEEVNLDFQVLGPAPSNPDEVEVLIAASRKEMVEDRVACAEDAGLRPLVMDMDAYASHGAYELLETQLPKGGLNQVIGVADIGANRIVVTMYRNGEAIYSREQAFGGYMLTQDIMRTYGMSMEEAEAAKRTNTLPENYEAELLTPFLQNLSTEVVRAMQFFFSSTPYAHVDHMILAGGCSVIPGIDEAVANETQVHTIVANPFSEMEIGSKVRQRNLQTDAPALLVACGLALRRFDR